MNIKALTVLFLVTTVIFAGLYFTKAPDSPQNVEIENPVNQTLKSEKKRLTTENKVLSDKVKSLEDQLALAKTARAKTAQVASSGKSSSKAELSDEKPQNPMAKMMNDPKVQEMMKSRRNQMINGRYGYLFKKLNLSDEDKEALTELLGERAMAAMSSRMKQFANRDDDDAKADADAEREEAESQVDAKIADLLGDDYEAYSDFNEKRREYEYVSGLNRQLGEDASLTDDQTDQLASVINETKSDYQFSNEKFNEMSSPWDAYRLSKEDKEEYVKELEVRDEMVLKDSSEFLDEGQQEALKKQQEKDRSRLTSGRRGFFGGRGGRGGR